MVRRLIGLTFMLCVLVVGGVKWRDLRAMGEAAMSAKKTAVRPGDAAMTCAALEKELVATMNGPAVRRYAATSAAAAQKQYGALQNRRAQMTGQDAATIAASLNSVSGYAQLALAQARFTATQVNALTSILPQLMRSQRLVQLAFTKQCRWMTPGTPPR